MNSLSELNEIFWQMTADILADLIAEPDRFIRLSFPREGAPDWRITDNVVFLNLSQRDDDYARQQDSIYSPEDGTVIRRGVRTRVWDLHVKAYGPRSFDIATAMQDGVFDLSTKRLLNPKYIFLVPYLARAVQANEIFAGQWWERWDTTLTFNERHIPKEDVGHIEKVPITYDTEFHRETQIITNR